MKASFGIQFGSAPVSPGNYLKVRVDVSEAAGLEAHSKFSSIMGKDVKFGVLLQIPTNNPELLEKRLSKEAISRILDLDEGDDPVELSQKVTGGSYYGLVDIDLVNGGLPEQFLGVSLKKPIKLVADIETEQDFNAIFDFAKQEPNIEIESASSRIICSFFHNMKAKVSLDVPPGSIEEVYSQIKDIIPIPLPSDPTIFSKIVENGELEITVDSLKSLPNPFLNDFWVNDFHRGLSEILGETDFWEDAFPDEKEPAKYFEEITDTVPSGIIYLHVFNKKWGSMTVEVQLRGLMRLMTEAGKIANQQEQLITKSEHQKQWSQHQIHKK